MIEVKCPYKYRDDPDFSKALSDTTFYLCMCNNQITLKTSHTYYHQIQGQLFLTGRKKAFFVVYIPSDLLVIEIQKDLLYDRNIQRLTRLYIDHYLPYLMSIED